VGIPGYVLYWKTHSFLLSYISQKELIFHRTGNSTKRCIPGRLATRMHVCIRLLLRTDNARLRIIPESAAGDHHGLSVLAVVSAGPSITEHRKEHSRTDREYTATIPGVIEKYLRKQTKELLLLPGAPLPIRFLPFDNADGNKYCYGNYGPGQYTVQGITCRMRYTVRTKSIPQDKPEHTKCHQPPLPGHRRPAPPEPAGLEPIPFGVITYIPSVFSKQHRYTGVIRTKRPCGFHPWWSDPRRAPPDLPGVRARRLLM